MNMIIILISKTGLPIAQSIRKEYPSMDIVTTTDAEGCTRVAAYEPYLSEEFAKTEVFIFIGAMGICVRLIAPHVQDKYNDPAVICIDSTGHYVIPVLSGHIGKANLIARQVAQTLGTEAIITTQSDRTGLWNLDTMGDKYGWAAVPHYPGTDGKTAMNRLIALFVAKEPTLLCIEARVPGTDELASTAPAHVTVCYKIPQNLAPNTYKLCIHITPFLQETNEVPTLCFVPKTWHIGIGLAHQASPAEDVLKALYDILVNARLNPLAIAGIATIDVKQNEPVIHALRECPYPIHFFTAKELKTVEVPTPSPVVKKHVGTPSVCEAAALLASGGGELVLCKQKESNYTLAVGVEQGVLHPESGQVEIVGAGPGATDLISVRGRSMLERADLILYAGSLIPSELTFYAKPGAVVRSSASMTLEEQFQLIKEFYDRGKFIVRLHTGDPCIYGAIEEQMNYFDLHHMNYHITPGISSFQAAAAELKSQFTIPERVQTIILTRGEGRTSMPSREKLHLLARSRSTMCIFLSASIAGKIQEELLTEYPADTPVAVCYHLTWPDQRIYRGRLSELAAIIHEHRLTLTTLIVVGDAIGNRDGQSRLYSDEFKHLFRP